MSPINGAGENHPTQNRRKRTILKSNFMLKTEVGYLVRPPILPHFMHKNMWNLVRPHILPHKHGVFGPSAHFTPQTWGIWSVRPFYPTL
jgi:hypothetical protein